MSDTLEIAYPEWTECRKKNGLDPLGMQNTSVGIYQKLIPGISNVTLRIRYYGFYAWLSAAYTKSSRDTNPKTWQRLVRRAEALYALVAQRHGSEHGVAGIQWAQRRLAALQSDAIDFADDAEPGSSTHYLKQAWGAFGAAYGSQLFEVSAFSEAAKHPIPVPSPQIGERLAERFGAECGALEERFLQAVERGGASLDDLDACRPMTPSGIKADSEERKLYQDLLFAETGIVRDADISRRKSLLLILHLTHQLGQTPDVNGVRWALYSGLLSDGTSLSLPPDLEDHRLRWRVYQANDLAHICFESLLKYLLDRLETYPDGIPLGQLVGGAVAAMSAASNDRPHSWNDFLEQSTPAESVWSDDPMAEIALADQVVRSGRITGMSGPDEAWKALRLLAVLHNRMRMSNAGVAEELGAFKLTSFRSLATELAFLDEHADDAFETMVTKLIEERVVRRHLWIALQKFRYQGDYTFLIESDEGRVRLRQKDGPVFTNPRLATTLTFLKDISLLADNGLTALGRKRIEAS